VSSKSGDTRVRILEAARALLEEAGTAETGLAEVGRRAGVSRQAVYLHFGSRTGLLVALVDHIDRRFGLYDALQAIQAEADPVRALVASQQLTARYAPGIHPTAAALARAGRDDEAAMAAFEERMELRRSGLRSLFVRIEAAGALAPGRTVQAAADASWAAGLPQVYEALVMRRGWSVDAYAQYLVDVAVALHVLPARWPVDRARDS
jgi:AcrR family transcriptional regulator